ncbi:cAMP-binding domain of CRP or a regulatory subunit of cAMP-dependent protein kinases [Maridesulfovibrio ferrireducens]|uniref:cAMP-binding domain of CRP or a regulatory subunit of cAMP-dependent protein kinases n=1 Tax=Maridesulfovibrio ferrireducens TaxID=246191 RepID=A0A1G9HXN2_9BACT|nr:cyclic nucleotide-binding domain-containing protein [Maridesulfovibrio ferrireducens]SDL17709.1 cAMP-binding domain of CRP or a regulatory subunit of cAMP-dependent protein kinases [Maridesulfovibrio ferrireducens]
MSSLKPKSITFSKGDVIFREGDMGNVAYIITKGTVNIVKQIHGVNNVLATLGSGEIFGEMAIISRSPRVAGAEAETSCTLMVLTANLIMTLLKKSHPTVFHLTRVLASRLATANKNIIENRSGNIWMTLCRLLNLKFRIFTNSPEQDKEVGVNYKDFCYELSSIINISESEIERMITAACSFNLITKSKMVSRVYLAINDPEHFLEVAESLSNDVNKFRGKICYTEYVDIHDFSELFDSLPELIYKKIGVGDFPEDICVLHKGATYKWAKKKGDEYFLETKRKRKSIEELENVNDIVFVDIGTLKQIFSRLGYYKLGILLAIAAEEGRDRILAAISSKIANAITKESKGLDAIDQNEADEVEEELLDMIREVKLGKKE